MAKNKKKPTLLPYKYKVWRKTTLIKWYSILLIPIDIFMAIIFSEAEKFLVRKEKNLIPEIIFVVSLFLLGYMMAKYPGFNLETTKYYFRMGVNI